MVSQCNMAFVRKLIIVLYLFQNVGIFGCPFGWLKPTGGSSCYFFGMGRSRKSWFKAREECLGKQGDLLKLDNQAEKDWILQQMDQLSRMYTGEQEWWVGLNNQKKLDSWVWADGSTYLESLVVWGIDEPNNHANNERCGEIWNKYFNDKNCLTKLNYVCERPAALPVTCDSDQGWEFHHGACYKFFSKRKVWREAYSTCRREGAEFAGDTTDDDHETFKHFSQLYGDDMWIGMYSPTSPPRWVFANGTRLLPVTVNHWMPSEPNIKNGHDNNTCVAINSSVTEQNNWYADQCDIEYSFVCQKPEGTCRAGFVMKNGLCYLFKSPRMSWYGASRFCRENNARLVEIRSEEEQNYINSELRRLQSIGVSSLWIGLSRESQSDSWLWTDGEVLSDYTHWSHISTAPHSQKACVNIFTGDVNGNWLLDYNCSSLKSFICINEALTTSRLTAATQRSTISSTMTTTTVIPASTPIRGMVTNTAIPNTRRPVITQRPMPTQRPTTIESGIIRTATPSPTVVTTPRPTTAAWSAQCGPYWEEDPNTHFCYQFNNDLRSWTQARATCVRHGGDLLSITSIQEQYYIGGRIRNIISDAVWIGANTRGEDKGWIWSDGSPFAFLNFATGEPDNVDDIEECVNMDVRSTKWGDKPCNNMYGYICKKIGIVNTTVKPYIPPPVIPEGKRYGCPENWTDYHSQCFQIVREKKTWLQARSYCRKIGGDLASIVDENEQNFILSQLPATHCYNLYHDEKCDKWAKTGECMKNPVWMKTHCHLSCGVCLHDCKNLHNGHQCDIWAQNKECSKNPNWMLPNCALSCGICDSAIHGGFWIGLHDNYLSNSFMWSNGDKITFTNWAKREPNNIGRYGEDCVITKLMGGQWNDAMCDSTMPGLICKRKKEVLPIPTQVTVPPPADGCSNGTHAYDAFCYSFFKNESEWNAAESHCASRNGHLATVNDRYVQAFLASLVIDMPADVWIGLTDSLTPGIFESWTGGTTLQFTHWFKQHTGNEDGTCVAMRNRLPVGLWVNGNCTDRKPYVCGFPREGFTTTTVITSPGVSMTTTEPPKCYEGWTEYKDNCYKGFKGNDQSTWIVARDKCRQLGADLVSIHDIGEEIFIVNTFMGRWEKVWIGFNDRDVEASYQWSDGSIVDYTNWSQDEPNNYFGYEDCAYLMGWNKLWNDDNCYKANPFVCEVKRGTPVKTVESTQQISLDHCGDDTDWVFKNGYCYLFKTVTDISEAKSWHEAERFCNQNGGYLASIHSRDDSNFILSVTSKGNSDIHMWIGLNELGNSGYKWSDSTPTDFILWSTGEPNDAFGGQKCARLTSEYGLWYDENCAKELQGFICKKVNGTVEPVSTQTTPIAMGGCPPHFFASPINSKCYMFRGLDASEESDSDDPQIWQIAVQNCKGYGNGYSLVTISDNIEHAFLLSQMGNFTEAFWIGLHDNEINGKYMWQDNTDVTITKWAHGEPNGYSENCVEMYGGKSAKSGLWNDVSCWNTRPYICQGPRATVYINTPAPSLCKAGYVQYGSSCYKFQTEDKMFKDAQALCKIDNGNLIAIDDNAEQAFTTVLTRELDKPFWIGMTKEQPSDFFTRWKNGWPVVYTNWDFANDEPSMGDGENCAVSLNQLWADASCDQLFPSVCEIMLGTVSPPTVPPKGSCPENAYIHKGSCYVFIAEIRPFMEAQRSCRSLDMDLVSIHDEAEMNHVVSVMSQEDENVGRIWIGFTRLKTFSPSIKKFVWVDKSADTGYKNWIPDEPTYTHGGEQEQCTEMFPTGGWNDLPCSFGRAYVCKKPIGSVTTELTSTTVEETTITITTNKAHDTVATDQPDISTNNTVNPVTSTPASQPLQAKPITAVHRSELRAGHIIGIFIGVAGAIIIVCAIIYVYRRLRPSGAYNTDKGFANALYLKTVDSVSLADADNVSVCSRTKICPS